MADLESRSETEKKFIVTEVTSNAHLNNLLIQNGTNKETLMSDEIRVNLQKLTERVLDSRKKLFLVETNEGNWSVIADSEDEVQKTKTIIEEISDLQGQIDPDKLWGECIYVHEFASAVGISDGNMSARGGKGYKVEKAIYPINGIHEIGFKNLKDQRKTIYFDLTSKSYVFTKKYRADKAIMEGIIVIDTEKGTDVISKLYQSDWTVDSFIGNEPVAKHVIRKIQDKFLRKK